MVDRRNGSFQYVDDKCILRQERQWKAVRRDVLGGNETEVCKSANVNMRQRDNDELGDDAVGPRPRQTIVYNDFNLELLVAHADAGVQQQQEMDEADAMPT